MTYAELSQTLTQLVAAIDPPAGSGLRVDSAVLEVPLEVAAAMGANGLILLARVPHSRWKAGVLPVVHMSRIEIGSSVDDDVLPPDLEVAGE